MTESEKKQLVQDILFLKKMKEQTDALINNGYDVTRVQLLGQMVSDWKQELEDKLKTK